MKCEFCNENNATIHLTQVVDGSMEKVESLSVVCGKKWNRLKLTHIHYGRFDGY